MDRRRIRDLLTACVVWIAASPVPAAAQDWFLDATLDRSFSSAEPLRSPDGFTLSTGAVAVWGPFGLHATFRSLADASGDTLAVSYRMRSAGVGISYDFINPTDVMLTLGLTGTRSWRREQVVHLATGARSVNELPTSLGLSASAHLRLRPLVSGFRPRLSVHYEYSGRGRCDLDTACWSGRNAFGVSVGLSWVLRAPREY